MNDLPRLQGKEVVELAFSSVLCELCKQSASIAEPSDVVPEALYGTTSDEGRPLWGEPLILKVKNVSPLGSETKTGRFYPARFPLHRLPTSLLLRLINVSACIVVVFTDDVSKLVIKCKFGVTGWLR